MSEYWKSVPRKFCDFCKCWITDNKPSVEFHERGKRHQENVELRLKEVRKKSLQNSMEEDEMKREMEKMEKAALEAFKKDLKDNPELAAKYGVSLEPKPQENGRKGDKKDADLSADAQEEENDTKIPKIKEWFEAATPEGYRYYWNTATGESKWEPPEEYVSVEEQEAMTQKSTETLKDSEETSESPAESEDTAAPLVKETKPAARVDPSHSRSAYGAWDVVKEIEKPVVYDETSAPPSIDDIPLPSDDVEESPPQPKKPKFKEKVVPSLGAASSGPVTFKKRKIAAGARNARQKNDDD